MGEDEIEEKGDEEIESEGDGADEKGDSENNSCISVYF